MIGLNAEKNEALVLEAFDTLLKKRDHKSARRFWSPNRIQHSAHIPPGREGKPDLARQLSKGKPCGLLN